MKRILLFLLLIMLVVFMLYKFPTSIIESSVLKMSKKDPFQKSMVKSQFFEINTKKDTVVEAINGTIVAFPKDCFVDSKGMVIEGNVDFELAEALDLSSMIFSNLTTTSNNQILETGGMVFINAYYKNKEVFINKEKPIYIEIPTNNFNPNMMKYEGIRDTDGNMNWINPKPLQNYLVPIDLNLLDFLPNGLEKEIRTSHEEILEKAFVDSTYYQLNCKLKHVLIRGVEISVGSTGINPRKIKTIKSKKFQNTFIATREFEKRLQFLFANCDDNLIDLYINNLDKNMWEVDEMVANQSDSIAELYVHDEFKYSKEKKLWFTVVDTTGYRNSLRKEFQNFAKQGKTNVKNGGIYSKVLKHFYESKLKENQNYFKKISTKIKENIKNEKKVLNELIKEYETVLNKREKYRMETYGFVQTETGWVNLDFGTAPKNWNYKAIRILIENNQSENDTYVYVIYQSINSLLRLTMTDLNLYEIEGGEMPTYKNEKLHVICISSKNSDFFFATKEVAIKELSNDIVMSLKEVSKKEIDTFLKNLKNNGLSNNLQHDIKYQEKIKKEEAYFIKKEEYIRRLEIIAFPCSEE